MTLQQLSIFCLFLLYSSIALAQSPVKTVMVTTDSMALADSATFLKTEVEAVFPGGPGAWGDYLKANLKANVPVKKKAPAGSYKVLVQFIVSKDGSINNIAPVTSFGYGMEEEVIRIMQKSPRSNTAMQNGRNVNAYRMQPVTFVVEGK